MNRKLMLAVTAVVLIGALISMYQFSRLSERISRLEELARLEYQLPLEQKRLESMSGQTSGEADATLLQGQKVKEVDSEIGKLRKKIDPEGAAVFGDQLDTYILTMKQSVVELKERADREKDPQFLRKAQDLQERIALFEQEQEMYLKNEKTVRKLRKELDLPAD